MLETVEFKETADKNNDKKEDPAVPSVQVFNEIVGVSQKRGKQRKRQRLRLVQAQGNFHWLSSPGWSLVLTFFPGGINELVFNLKVVHIGARCQEWAQVNSIFAVGVDVCMYDLDSISC